MLDSLKNIYKKLGSGTAVLSGLRAHDEQIAQLRAAVGAILAEATGLSAAEKEAAKAKIEGLLAYQAIAKDEAERLRALYGSAATRLAAAEVVIAELQDRVSAMEDTLKRRGGRT